jgi:chromosome segregation ATPase
MSLIHQLKKMQAGEDPRAPWLRFVREVGSGRITDVATIAAELPKFGKTPDELDSALRRFEELTHRVNLARQLPALEAKRASLAEQSQAAAAEVQELRQQIIAMEKRIEARQSQERGYRLEAAMVNADAMLSQVALERLQDPASLPQLPDDLREDVATLATLQADLRDSGQAVEQLATDRERARPNSEQWVTCCHRHASAAGHHAHLEQECAEARARVMAALGA